MSHENYQTLSLADLSPKQKEVIYALEAGDNILVTGGAGTGKSHLLHYIKQNYKDYGLALTASTGIAAVNIGASTIHSWSGIGIADLPVEKIVENLFLPKYSRIRKRIRYSKILAIDEISMISAKIFDILNIILKKVKESEEAFGGIQMLLFGDFFQLPPIIRNENDGNNEYKFIFQSLSWKELNPKIILLDEIFRQKNDLTFQNILNNIRLNKINKTDIDLLNKRIIKDKKNLPENATILTTHNIHATNINNKKLRSIEGESYFFKAKYEGDKSKIDFLKKNAIAVDELELKIGARVMMLKNTYVKYSIINGSTGTVIGFTKAKKYPIILFDNNVKLNIVPEEWNLEEYNIKENKVKITASLSQIPLILSWAITIHKSQGMTLDKVICNLSNIFSDGQIYVALSRVRSIEDLYIEDINFNKLSVEDNLKNFYHNISHKNEI